MMGSSIRMIVARACRASAVAFAAAGRVALPAVGLVALTTMTTSCPAPPPAVPEPCNKQVVTLMLYAADDVNPNESNRPRPVVVRLYQLANDMKMLNAKYDDILLKDKETLGPDLLKVDEVEVFPNDLVEVKFERIPDAAMLCGAAMFHAPKGQSWKTYYTFPPMPNAPAACAAPDCPDAGAGQANPKTAFFVVESKIDNGSQYDESMFPNATPVRHVTLTKASASEQAGPAAPAAGGK